MALAGLHVACGYFGGDGFQPQPLTVFGQPVWSENLASPGTTTNAVPAKNIYQVNASLEVSVAADSYVAIGPTPDASAGPRLLVRSGTARVIVCRPGDKLAWIAA